jgi:hypothetical protein
MQIVLAHTHPTTELLCLWTCACDAWGRRGIWKARYAHRQALLHVIMSRFIEVSDAILEGEILSLCLEPESSRLDSFHGWHGSAVRLASVNSEV